MRFEQPTICFKSMEKNGYLLEALRILGLTVYKRKLSCGSLLLIISVIFGAIFISVYINE